MSAFLTPAELGLIAGDKCLPSPEAIQREVELLKARLASHRQRRADLVRNLSLNAPRNIPDTERQVQLLDRAILCLARKIAKLEHRVPPTAHAVDWTRGKLLSAEARGLAGLEPAAARFPSLPTQVEHGMSGREECVSEEYVVLPEYVNSVQPPAERVFQNSVGFEAGGDAVEQSASPDLSFENLTGGESFDGVEILNGLSPEGGVDVAGDGVDAGGEEDLTNVVQTDFASDEGAIDGDGLVEPGQAQQPQDVLPARAQAQTDVPAHSRLAAARQPQVARQQVRQQVRQPQCAPQRPTLANAHRFRQGNGAVSSLPFRGQGAGALGHQANGMGRLDVQRALLRRPAQGTGMGQVPALNLASKLVDAAANIGTSAIQARSGVPAQTNQTGQAENQNQSQNQSAAQPSFASRYMPLILLGGGAIVATAAYFAFFRKSEKKDD